MTTTSTPKQPGLWDFRDVCTFHKVSERKGAEMRAAGLLPAPVVLGPRALRWIPEEVEAAARAMPRLGKLLEPVQLANARRARIEKLKTDATSAA